VLSFVFYFSGFWITLIVILTCYPIIDSVGFKAEAEMLSDGQDVPYTTVKFGLGFKHIVNNLSFTKIIQNITPFSLVFLEIAIAIGAGRFLQAALGSDVTLSNSSEHASYRVITSSADGVILLDSRDATLINLLFSDVSYLVVTASGEHLLIK
jgi:hypothetical protein